MLLCVREDGSKHRVYVNPEQVTTVELDPKGRATVSTSDGKTLKVWDRPSMRWVAEQLGDPNSRWLREVRQVRRKKEDEEEWL